MRRSALKNRRDHFRRTPADFLRTDRRPWSEDQFRFRKRFRGFIPCFRVFEVDLDLVPSVLHDLAEILTIEGLDHRAGRPVFIRGSVTRLGRRGHLPPPSTQRRIVEATTGGSSDSPSRRGNRARARAGAPLPLAGAAALVADLANVVDRQGRLDGVGQLVAAYGPPGQPRAGGRLLDHPLAIGLLAWLAVVTRLWGRARG